MRSRGLEISDHAAAIQALKRIGYYRLSAYSYPLREQVEGPDPRTREPRPNRFVPGSRLEYAVELHDFDHRLRRTLLPAIQSIEISLRTKVAYHLGKHGPFAHISRDGLDRSECDSESRGPDHAGTKYDSWRREYDKLQTNAKEEEYVRHFLTKYDGQVPIWAATEFMTMGCLISLYSKMLPRDAGRIAEELGLKNKDVLFGWVKALNVLRNHCAHNARLWNRSTVYPPDRINIKMVGPDLHHLVPVDRNKVYFLAAIIAYLTRRIDTKSRFVHDFTTVMTKFPHVPGITPENSMGFTPGWKQQQLWRL
jgi:abortive infection bacteriophage resistance protein